MKRLDAWIDIEKNYNGRFVLDTRHPEMLRKYLIIARIYGQDDETDEIEFIGYELYASTNNRDAALAKAASLEGEWYDEVDVYDIDSCELIER